MAGAIDKQHFCASLQPAAERLHLIMQVATGAVDEHQGRQVCILGFWQMNSMQPVATHIGKIAGGRVALFYASNLKPGEQGQAKNERNDGQEQIVGHEAGLLHIVKYHHRQVLHSIRPLFFERCAWPDRFPAL